ncbi:MAG: ABC-type phosphate transport system, permease component [uncultured Acidilobus sp. CIS]|nr:MAG: ABC-type phosphate transport system, permease component [uncultured Acidilobus sp. CIS]
MTTVAVLLAIPLSIGLTIFIAELSPKAVRDVLINISDLMAAFPTVVYGLWGLTELGPFLKSTLFAFINRYLGFLPVFSGTPTGVSYLLASMVLAVMISPFASSLIREIYLQVPRSLDEGVYALGLGRWEVVRIRLGFIKRGIAGALALAFGRAVGETVAVAMTVGGVVAINKSLLSPGITIPAYIANLFGEAFSTVDVASFFMLSLILLGIGTAFLAAARLFILSEQREVRTYGKA